MTIKLVKLYGCSFCKKKGRSAGHMAKHERHCTMNPNRFCRVCSMVGSGVQCQPNTKDLVALLPVHPRSYYEGAQDEDGTIGPDPNSRTELAQALPKLRDACSNCPACILAAIRQAGIPVYCVEGFDFGKEMKFLWSCINEEKVNSCNGGY